MYNGPTGVIRPSICALVALFVYTLKWLIFQSRDDLRWKLFQFYLHAEKTFWKNAIKFQTKYINLMSPLKCNLFLRIQRQRKLSSRWKLTSISRLVKNISLKKFINLLVRPFKAYTYIRTKVTHWRIMYLGQFMLRTKRVEET